MNGALRHVQEVAGASLDHSASPLVPTPSAGSRRPHE
jgi:hypothetical protein